MDTTLGSSPHASSTLSSYFHDEAVPRSPMLMAKTLQLRVSASPPPDSANAQPTRADIVLIQYLGDGQNPDICNSAADLLFSDEEEDDSGAEKEEAEEVREDKKTREDRGKCDDRADRLDRKEDAGIAGENGENRADVHKEYDSHDNFASLVNCMDEDTERDNVARPVSRPERETVSLMDLVRPSIRPLNQATEPWTGKTDDDRFPNDYHYHDPYQTKTAQERRQLPVDRHVYNISHINNINNDNYDNYDVSMGTQKKFASPMPLQETTVRPKAEESKAGIHLASMAHVASRPATFVSGGRESSPMKLESVALNALNLKEHRSKSAEQEERFLRSPEEVYSGTSYRADPSRVQPKYEAESSDLGGHLPTPASISTVAATTPGQDLWPSTNITNLMALSASSIKTPPETSPNELSACSPYPTSGPPPSSLPRPLPPMQCMDQFDKNYIMGDMLGSCMSSPGIPSPSSPGSFKLPSIRDIMSPRLSDAAADEQRIGGATSSPHYSSFHASPHAPAPPQPPNASGGLPSLTSMTNSRRTPPISPNDVFRRRSELASPGCTSTVNNTVNNTVTTTTAVASPNTIVGTDTGSTSSPYYRPTSFGASRLDARVRRSHAENADFSAYEIPGLTGLTLLPDQKRPALAPVAIVSSTGLASPPKTTSRSVEEAASQTAGRIASQGSKKRSLKGSQKDGQNGLDGDGKVKRKKSMEAPLQPAPPASPTSSPPPPPQPPHRQQQQQQHATPGTYKCTVEGCSAAPFQTQYLLNSHAKVHSSDRPHFCDVEGCPRSLPGNGFKRKNEMIRHGLVHLSPGYVCPYCQDREHRYPRPDNLQRHVKAHHQDKPKDDPLLRDVLAQRPHGPNQRRRRRIA